MIDKLLKLDLNLPVVVTSDYIIDHIIKLKSRQELFDLIDKKVQFGAGVVRRISIHEQAGGKAVNVAYCLAKLGLNVALFCIADKTGLDMFKQRFSSFGDGINLHIKNGKQGYNTAFEFFDEVSRVNLSDIKDTNKFGPETLTMSELFKVLLQ